MNPRDGATITREMAHRWTWPTRWPACASDSRSMMTKHYTWTATRSAASPRMRGQVAKALEAWRSDLIIAWREWIRVPRQHRRLIAQSVVEARAGEIIVGDSTSVNLYKAAAAAMPRSPPGRTDLVTERRQLPDRPLRAAVAGGAASLG